MFPHTFFAAHYYGPHYFAPAVGGGGGGGPASYSGMIPIHGDPIGGISSGDATVTVFHGSGLGGMG
jgi:hypothetical protein